MDSLRLKFEKLKEKIKSQQNEDEVLRRQVKCALKAVFSVQDSDCDSLCDFHLKNGNLILKAKNKVLANELFLRKSQLLASLSDNGKVKSVIVH